MDGPAKIGHLTLARVEAANVYCTQHPEAKLVVFSGSGVLDGSPDAVTEAAAMIGKAQLPDGVEAKATPNARSTVENFLESEQFLSGEVVGILTHRRHSPRTLWLGRLALPQHTLVPIIAEDYGALPEDGSGFFERLNYLATPFMYFGVNSREELVRREALIGGFKLGVKRVGERVKTLGHRATLLARRG